jgi:hypothetical protein
MIPGRKMTGLGRQLDIFAAYGDGFEQLFIGDDGKGIRFSSAELATNSAK